MRMQGFRGNCDSKGKLGMCPSLAEPDSGGIPREMFHVKQCSWENQLRAVRQNRFAVCLCAVRRWLRCSNC